MIHKYLFTYADRYKMNIRCRKENHFSGQAAETIIDLENLGRFMLLDAAAGHVTIQKLSITRGNCAALVGNEVGAGFALTLVIM